MQAPQRATQIGNPVLTPDEAMNVFRQIFELLEEYAPSWYSEELRNSAVAILPQNYEEISSRAGL